MFDDAPENLPTGGDAPAPQGAEPTLSMPEAPEPAPAAPEAAPAPAPAGEPKDMFEAGGQPAPSVPTPELPTASTAAAPEHGGTGKIVVLVVVVLLVLGLVGVAAAWFMGAFQPTEPSDSSPIAEEMPSPPVAPDPTPEEPADVPEDMPAEPTDKLAPEEPIDEEPVEAAPVVDVDSDGDGLTDAEEAAFGTSTFKPDTDNDGLFDLEEVRKYNTNPLNPDTDDDGYLDGEEVRNGFNPAGPGALFTVPAAE